MKLTLIRNLFSVIFMLLFSTCVFAQVLNQVRFAGGSKFSYFSLLTDRDVQIRISDAGKITEWGTEEKSIRDNINYAQKLLPYTGRVEYYGAEGDSVSKGKLKSIGTAKITYYGPYESEFKIGKIKSVGSLLFDYYIQNDNNIIQGKIKSIGTFAIDYYYSFENDAYKGNLKSIGNTTINYHSSFDDKQIRGKIKSIGSVNFSWYTSFDGPRYGSGLKSGLYRHSIGTITYILQ
jgi:hypothetical protein